MPYGLLTPASWVAMFTQRWMHNHRRHQGRAVRSRPLDPRVRGQQSRAFFYQRTFDRAEYDAARMIADPLQLFDCCQESDGGSCVIVTTPERARDLKQPGVSVRGVAQAAAADQEQMTSFYREEFAAIPEMELAAKNCYAMSGLTPNDIDAAVIYDAFSPIVLWQMEAWGFCGFGESGDFVLGRRHAPGRASAHQHPWRTAE